MFILQKYIFNIYIMFLVNMYQCHMVMYLQHKRTFYLFPLRLQNQNFWLSTCKSGLNTLTICWLIASISMYLQIVEKSGDTSYQRTINSWEGEQRERIPPDMKSEILKQKQRRLKFREDISYRVVKGDRRSKSED